MLVMAPMHPTAPISSGSPAHWNGYVADTTCAACHADIAASFSTHSMSRSFAHPERAHWVETFAEDGAISYEEDRTRYQFVRSGDELKYRRWQVGPDRAPIHLWERSVDWVLGSGSNSRVYLVQSTEGALYELPIAWYSQTREFAPTPGTMAVEREGRLRVVRRPCMFCHNAVPSDPSFNDHRFAPQFFPHELPGGIGCQRCHGPGLRHLEEARSALNDRPETPAQRRAVRDEVRRTIVNPSKLDPGRRRDVCAQCHHQPTVALFGQRRFDRNDYDFSAGEHLNDFLLKLDIIEAETDGSPRPAHDRFEINHHAYRLEQSPCYLQSPAGALECTSCHDPHRDQTREVTFDRARVQCLECHATGGASEVPADFAQHLDTTDCVTCHMPRRRTEDIVRVVMTDHRIQPQPVPEAQRLAPLAEQETAILDVFVLDPRPDAATPTDDLMRAAAGVRAGSLQLTHDLERLIEQARNAQPNLDLREPEMRLANALVQLARESEALPILDRLRREPSFANRATELAAIAHARQDRQGLALDLIDPLIDDSDAAPAHLLFNRGVIRLAAGHSGACDDLQKATERNEFLGRAWTYLGRCRETEGDLESAADAYRQTLRLDPSEERTAALLIAALRRLDRDGEADRLEAHARARPADH